MIKRFYKSYLLLFIRTNRTRQLKHSNLVRCKKLENINGYKKLKIEFDELIEYKKPKAILLINDDYYIFCSRELIGANIERSQKIALMTDILSRLAKQEESVSVFSEMFDLESFASINVSKKIVYNFLLNSEDSYTDLKKIKIDNINICVGEEK